MPLFASQIESIACWETRKSNSAHQQHCCSGDTNFLERITSFGTLPIEGAEKFGLEIHLIIGHKPN